MKRLYWDSAAKIMELVRKEDSILWAKTRSDWEIQNSANQKIEDGKRYMIYRKLKGVKILFELDSMKDKITKYFKSYGIDTITGMKVPLFMYHITIFIFWAILLSLIILIYNLF